MPDYYQEYIICRYSYFYDATKIISDLKIEFIHQQSPGKKVYLSGKKKKKKQEKCKGSYWTRIWLLWSWYALEEVSKWQDVKGSSLPVDRSKARNFKFQQNVLKLFHLFALWSRYLKATQGIIEQASQHESLYFINYTDIVLFFLYLSHK